MKISVVTATFNVERTVESCLDSVASQDYGNVEHVVVDGASTDRTMAVLERHSDRIDRFVSEPDEGIYDALNKGIELADGDVVGFLHADDVFADERVLSRIAEAFADDSVSGVYGDLQYVRSDDTDRVFRHWRAGAFRAKQLRWGWMPPHPTLYVRQGWYTQIGGFDTRYRIAADYHAMLKLFSNPEFHARYIPEV